MIDGSPDGLYKRLEELGRGSFGKVYKVQHRRTGEFYALKLVAYHGMSSKLYNMQTSEIELLTSVHHPGIINYHEAYDDRANKEFGIIMDIFTKGDLHSYINRKRINRASVSEQSIWTILSQLAYALSYCHSKTRAQGIEFGVVIHRDIKPENILISDDGRVVFSDFGICRALEERKATGTVVGTIAYLAPEIAAMRPYDEKVDIWSLGCTIYELCTRTLLFRVRDIHDLANKHKDFNPESVIIQHHGYSEQLETVLKTMLQLDPATRISAAEICQIDRVRVELDKFKQMMSEKGNVIPQEISIPNAPRTPVKRIVSASPSPVVHPKRISVNSQQEQHRLPHSRPASPLSVEDVRPRHEAALQSSLSIEDLILAVRQNNVTDIRGLSKMLARKTDSSGRSALMHAVIMDRLEAVKILAPLESGLVDKSGHTALHYACAKKEPNKQILSILGEVEGRVVNSIGRTSLMLLIKDGRKDVAQLLVNKSYGVQDMAGTTALILAIRYGQTDIAMQLVPKEQKLVMKNGWSALMEAAQQGNITVAKSLRNAESGLRGNMEWTALMVAAAHGSDSVCKILIDVEGKQRDTLGETALMKAARAGKSNCAQVLLRTEGKLVRPDGKSALMCAAEAGHTECVRVLCATEAGLKKQDGRTALKFALERGHTECANLLRPYEDNTPSRPDVNRVGKRK